jgi:hypothetical protein
LFVCFEGTKQCFDVKAHKICSYVLFISMITFLFAVGHAVPAMNYERRPKRGRRSMSDNYSPAAIW